MTKKSGIIFIILQVIVWIIFVGLCIEAGGLLVNFGFSIFKPESVKYLYQKLDLSAIYNQSQFAFYSLYSFMLSIALLKAYLFYLVIKLTTKFDLSRPFNSLVAKQIIQISYITFSTGLLSYLAQQTSHRLFKNGFDTASLNQFWGDSQAYILMAAVIFIIASIFTRGVELQKENDMTV